MNITLSIDEELVERARKVARTMGTSLNQIVRDYIEDLAGKVSPEEEVREIRDLSTRAAGRSRGWRFNRDEIHERS